MVEQTGPEAPEVVTHPNVCPCGRNLHIWQNPWNHEPGCPMTPSRISDDAVLAADAEVESALLTLDAATERYRDALDAREAIERTDR